MDNIDTKKYNHTFVELEVKKLLKDKKFYEFNKDHQGPKFSIILPPPNITGKLHLGHAWDTSLQDAIIRYKHLQGFNTLWISGLDHASIATQSKYEKILKETENKSRLDFSRQEFLEKLNVWSKQQMSFIRQQWENLNLCLSLDSQCFTMDEHVHKACMEFFVELYNKGLIYQDLKLVNWDTQLQTAISDIEVVYKETNSKMYYFKYWLEDKSEFLTVATTRPETMFGDVCLVINPKDTKNIKYLGKKAFNPVNNQLLDIIADEYVELGFGTGIMKATPAHDFNDYVLAKKHNITNYQNVFNPDGTLNKLCIGVSGNKYEGLPIKVARKQVVEALKERDLVIKIEDIVNNIGYSDRTGTVVEPYLSKQWFVKMKPLAEKVVALQKENAGVEFIPSRFNDALLNWLNNIQDWCISRQLWWGHQLPVWYHKETKEVLVSVEGPKDVENWKRDEDVLDTWFSSGLWPLVTTNWRESSMYQDFYPNSLLVTAYDILFFWVARMMTMCKEKSNVLPFKQTLIHGLVRDKNGKKMSKSLGNGIDPNDLISKYGSDAMKMFFTSSATMGEDLRFNEEKIKYYWSVLNKMWNSYQLIKGQQIKFEVSDLNQFDCWMLDKLENLKKIIIPAYEKYDFTVANKYLIDCFWNEYCNQYLEFIKTNLNNENAKKQKSIALFIFDEFLKLFYPIAPAITDYLFYEINHKYIWYTTVKSLNLNYQFDRTLMKHFANIANALRDYRIKHSLSKKNEIKFLYSTKDQFDINQINNLLSMFNLKLDSTVSSAPKKCLSIIVDDAAIYLSEQAKSTSELEKKLKEIEFEITRSENILSNQNFISKAPKEKVDLEKKKLEKYLNDKKIILDSLKK